MSNKLVGKYHSGHGDTARRVDEIVYGPRISAHITLTNSIDLGYAVAGTIAQSAVRRVSVPMLCNSGALMLVINEEMQSQLGLMKLDRKPCELADGSIRDVDVVGPVEVQFENRSTSCRAIVLPGATTPLLGAIPMEDLDVVLNMQQHRLTVNPAHPMRPLKPVK